MVRLRKVLERVAPALVPQSRPYRLVAELETDVQHVVSLLDRCAHRLALAASPGPVLPASLAPGVGVLRAPARETLPAGSPDQEGGGTGGRERMCPWVRLEGGWTTNKK